LALSRGHSTGQRGGGGTSEAQRLYAIGRYYWDLRTQDGVRRSMAYFARVIDADPHAAIGYAAMADANAIMGDYCYGTHRPTVYFARARSYAQKTLTLDGDSAEALAALGFVELHQANATSGLSKLRRAIALNPAYAPAHEWLGVWLARHGAPEQALEELRTVANLEPLSVSTTQWLGYAALRLNRRIDAALYAREARELSPERSGSAVPPNHPVWAEFENVGALPLSPVN
jgi:tetratricopeptide (TPR) repeat protein